MSLLERVIIARNQCAETGISFAYITDRVAITWDELLVALRECEKEHIVAEIAPDEPFSDGYLRADA
jgi:hypothetical protein